MGMLLMKEREYYYIIHVIVWYTLHISISLQYGGLVLWRMLLLQIEAWNEAITSCNSVLRVQPDNVKALFRKAKVNNEFYFFMS